MKRSLACDAEWPFVLTLLPPDWEASAKTMGALQRQRGVRSASALLRLAFAYGCCGRSLHGTATWAREAQVAQLSAVALLKRLQHAAPWLGHLVAQKLAQRAALQRERLPGDLHLRLVDATSISRPGSTGTDFRVHLGFALATLSLDAVAVTTAAGGEDFQQLPLQPGDVVIGDRGYARRQGIAAVVAAGAQVLVRLNWNNVPLEHPDGRPFDLLAALRSLPDAQAGEWPVRTAPGQDGTPAVAGRLIAIRKSPEAAEAARRRVQQRARRKGQTPDARTLETAGYLFLFTTLPAAGLTAAQALELYRFRWQIELAFKRLKSLLSLDELTAQEERLCRTFLLVKLLAALLIDELRGRWLAFSPWGYGGPTAAVGVAGGAGIG